MAGISTTPFLLLLLLLLLSSAVAEHSFATTGNAKHTGLRKEKLSHFRLYWHDILTGHNPSSVRIVQPVSNTSRTFFGSVQMIDNPLTETADPRSKLWGRAQGMYAFASQGQGALLMAMNLAFSSGKYNGSSITVFGRNSFMDKVREMPVIAGSGLFRFARGYVKATTTKIDLKTGNAVVQYDIYVLHYSI